MPNTLDSIKYVKYNKARLKAGKRNGNKSMLLEYFKEHEGKVRGDERICNIGQYTGFTGIDRSYLLGK